MDICVLAYALKEKTRIRSNRDFRPIPFLVSALGRTRTNRSRWKRNEPSRFHIREPWLRWRCSCSSIGWYSSFSQSLIFYLSLGLCLSLCIYPSIYLCLYIETLFTPVRMPPTPPHSMMTPLAQSPFAFRMIHSRKTSAASSTSVSRKRGRTVIVTGRICRWFPADADAFLAMIGWK